MIDTVRPSELLRPYEADGWTRRDATHLLWRTQHGATFAEIDQATRSGLSATLDRLLKLQPESAEFASSERLLRQVAVDTGDINNLKAWWLYRMLHSANPLVEKMSLFWHNHFATSNAKVRSVQLMAAQNDLIRREALGSFRSLLSGMTRDVAMLVWLDGNANQKRHPNENFAREVMELFSLGVGNYSEHDIAEAARAFTGWHVRNNEFWFNAQQHDRGTKTVLGRTGDLNGGDVIDVCLARSACPRFLAGKLLKTFVMPRPNEEAVTQLAGRIRAHDFKMGPALRELFGSKLFFSAEARQSIIKSPLEFVLGSCRSLGSHTNLTAAVRALADLGQDVFEPPTVKGWEGGRLWINSATLLQRANFAAELTGVDRLGAIEDPNATTTTHGLAAPEEIVRYYTELLLARDLDRSALNPLADYLNAEVGGQRIRGLIHLVMTMPEYQLV